jgi:hypothetical protein
MVISKDQSPSPDSNNILCLRYVYVMFRACVSTEGTEPTESVSKEVKNFSCIQNVTVFYWSIVQLAEI